MNAAPSKQKDRLDVSETLATFAATVEFGQLSEKAIETSKRSLLDAIGVTLAANTLGEACAPFIALARHSGERSESRVLGMGFKTSAAMAAFANGSMAHALDFEDSHAVAFAHPNAASIPAALAIAESRESTDGKALLTAISLGSEISSRLGLAFTEDPNRLGWYIPPMLNGYGAAAAAGHLLGLDASQMRAAFALALSQFVLTNEFNANPESHLRAVRDAFSAKAGVIAAQLAKHNVIGLERPFEGDYGFFAMFGDGRFDAARLVDGLGLRFDGANLSYKPWPSCRGTHSSIEAALAICAVQGLSGVDIESIEITVSPAYEMLCVPPDLKRHPQTAIGAKFSIPFTVATAITKGNVTLADFTDLALADPEILAIAQRVTCRTDRTLSQVMARSGTVEIETRDGRRFTKQVHFPLGHPDNPISTDAIIAKFKDCARYATTPLAEDRVERIIDLVFTLDRLPSAKTLIEQL